MGPTFLLQAFCSQGLTLSIALWEWTGIEAYMEVQVNSIFCHQKGNEALSRDVLKLTLTSGPLFMWSVSDLRKETCRAYCSRPLLGFCDVSVLGLVVV